MAAAGEVLPVLLLGAMPLLAARYPEFFSPHGSARGLVLALNDIIHPEVRKLYPGAEVPDFDFSEAENGDLVIGYRSERRLCALAEGFIQGAANHYGERVTMTQPRCMHRGDDKCLIQCSFGGTSGG